METTCAARAVAKSEAVGKLASTLMSGGVMSAFYTCNRDHGPPAATRIPPVIAKGKGATLTDLDGNEYVDYIGGHGALILGHAEERVVAAISKAASKGSGFGAPSEVSVRLAELIIGRLPSVDTVLLADTPGEALAYAISSARESTGRDETATFDGYGRQHEGGAVFHCSVTTGGATSAACHTLPYNDVDSASKLFRGHGSAIAAVIVEPVSLNMGLIHPQKGFLSALRALCDEHGALLILDERYSGFRVAPCGAGEMQGVSGDFTILGPIIGGGLPLAACCGRKDAMQRDRRDSGALRPHPDSGNLLAMAAGTATLQATGEPGFYEALEAKSARLDEGLHAAVAAVGLATSHARVGSILGVFFGDHPATEPASTRRFDTAFFARYHGEMLDRGVLLPPFPLSSIFVSSAHTDDDIDRTIEAAHEALRITAQ